MRNLELATVKAGYTVFHLVPEGNDHARCGRIAKNVVSLSDMAGRRPCKSCAKVAPARDTSRPVDPFLSEPTDVWAVTNKAGAEITRVYGTTMERARNEALEVAEVRRVNYAEGGFSLRRLTMSQLKAPRT